MRLEAVTAELRPRSDWEAVDLGFALVRRDFWRLSGAWWLGMLPILLLAPLLWSHPFGFALLFWWWVPVASRLALFKLSRILFGDDPGWGALWREFPKAVGRRFIYRMLWARFSPWRPLTMPVEDLEGLRGKDYRARCRILMRRGDSSVIVLAMWRFALVFWLALGLICTSALFVSSVEKTRWLETLSLWGDGDWVAAPGGLGFVIMLSLCGAMWLVDLFSVGCGFGIYVNHRTWIEGWDVELAFRRLGNRLRGLAGMLVAALTLGFAAPAEAVDREQARDEIDAVLSHPDFEVHKEEIKNWDWDWDWNFGSGLSGGGSVLEILGMFLKVAFFGGLLALLVWLIYRYRHVFVGKGGTRVKPVREAARVVMGMEVTPESLPDDVAGEALRHWRAGRHHEALSLLYRGAIAWMIRHGGVEIAESDTENDCLGRVSRAEAGHLAYFQKLTGEWVRLAYARERPQDVTVEELCGGWPFGKGGAA